MLKQKLYAVLTFGFFFTTVVKSQRVLVTFNSTENLDWPNVIWTRDLANDWDEGIIKTSSATYGVSRSGFGFQMNENRQFTFWSTSFNPLFSIDAGSWKTYSKRKLGLGTFDARAALEVASDIGGVLLRIVFGRQNESNMVGEGVFVGVRGYGTQFSTYDGKAFQSNIISLDE